MLLLLREITMHHSSSLVLCARHFLHTTSALTKSVALATIALGVTPAFAGVGAFDTPVGENVVGGAATFDRPSVGQLNVNQSTDRVVINWDSFNIGGNATTQFIQPGAGSLAVNRVVGDNTDPTQILGNLKSNGRVMVLDRNGVIFGNNAKVDVGGIIAAAGDTDTDVVMSGTDRLELNGFDKNGEVSNRGEITVADGGLAALVAPSVKNTGVINAKLGTVVLAAGEVVTIDLTGDHLFEIANPTKFNKLTVRQVGAINAEGGVVQMSVGEAKNSLNSIINMSGTTNASSATMQGGKIILSAGRAVVTGTLDATGTTGGQIKISTKNDTYVKDGGQIKTNAGGSIDIDAGNDIRLFNTAEEQAGKFLLSASTITSGGADITLTAAQQVQITDGHSIDAEGGNILINNGEALIAESGSIRTTGSGSITLNQYKAINDLDKLAGLNTIQAAIDAIDNTGNGTNTANIGAGLWDEDVYVSGYDLNNLTLNGVQAGVDPTTGARIDDAQESVVHSLYAEYLTQFILDGFTFDGGSEGEGSSRGVYVRGVNDSLITNNIVRNYWQDGILVTRDYYGPCYDCGNEDKIQAYLIEPSYYEGGYNTVITNNMVDNSFFGIEVNNIDSSEIGNNVVNNTFAGVYVSGPIYGYHNIRGNTVNDSLYGMAFESGLIDLTGDTNTLNGGDVGYLFKPIYAGYNGGSRVESVVYDEGGYYSSIDLVDNTIGTTEFNGQETYFVELWDGALFAPGLPTLENGVNASYNGFSPSSTGGIVTDTQLAFLESMFWHFNDDPSVGLFFFGTVGNASQSFEDQQDAFNQFDLFVPQTGGAGFTITGLPNLPGGVNNRGTGNQGGNLAANLNDITPAAGGDDNQTPEELAAIAPAAGEGGNTSCWGDAVARASQGQTASYSFTTGAADALRDASSCGNRQQ
jgi:filamentous hemagglutinin family protein